MPACLQGPRQHLILVVDGDRELSKLVRCNLEDEDTRVVEATTGLEGIKLLNEGKVDLIVLDIKLPDFSGWGILGLLRMSEAYRWLPVIMASAEPPDNALMGRLKPDSYLRKPFDMRELTAKVAEAIGSK